MNTFGNIVMISVNLAKSGGVIEIMELAQRCVRLYVKFIKMEDN